MNTAPRSPAAMLDLLERWVAQGKLQEIDLALVRFLNDESSGIQAVTPGLMLAAALVSHQLGRGHVCLDLEHVLNDPGAVLAQPEELAHRDETTAPHLGELLAGWTLAGWIAQLHHADLVEAAGPTLPSAGNTPLVLAGHRLYLRRYWRYERQVEAAIRQRIAASASVGARLPEAALKDRLNALFPPTNSGITDWQKIACALAARSAFSIVTGGPGTGKTTTVVRLLALLQSLALTHGGQALQIRLAAPTGKAAARLKASIAGAIDQLPAFVQNNTTLKAGIPHDVTTLHRLLGSQPDSRRFRHDARNPLPLDILVVDEGSMVDLEMMAALLQALPPDARLILLGDKDQLASVEAGSVLGELCREAHAGHFLPDTAHWIQSVAGESIGHDLIDPQGRPFDQHVVMLRQSHRFDAKSGIGQLAAAVNAGDQARMASVWEQGHADLFRHDLQDFDAARMEDILLGIDRDKGAPQGFSGYLHVMAQTRPALDADRSAFDAWAHRVLTAYNRFQLLCVLRHGPFGVSGLNRHIEEALKRHKLIRPAPDWYEGRPVLVTRNDYRLGLMNGDIGITLACPLTDVATGHSGGNLRVAFPKPDGESGIHWVQPSRLAAVETVFALTVHKSQGSEFEHCALLLPPERNPLLTRELVYTGITRAQRWCSLICIGNSRTIEEAAARTVQRASGLFASSG